MKIWKSKKAKIEKNGRLQIKPFKLVFLILAIRPRKKQNGKNWIPKTTKFGIFRGCRSEVFQKLSQRTFRGSFLPTK